MDGSEKKHSRNSAVQTPMESETKPRARLRERDTPPFGSKKLSVPPQKLDQLKETIESVSEIRVKKIAPIKKAVADGAYRVDADKIARRVVDEAANDALHRGKCGLDRWPQDAD